MTTLTSRFAARLLVPALAIGALAALGEPITAASQTALPSPTEHREQEMASVQHENFAIALALQQEAEAIRQEAEAAKKAARQTAAQMRWFLTLPAAGSRRCSARDCAS